MTRERELWERLEKLEARVAQLEARPQQTHAMNLVGNYWPWGTHVTAEPMVAGDNVSRETSMGPNGSAGKTPPDMA